MPELKSGRSIASESQAAGSHAKWTSRRWCTLGPKTFSCNLWTTDLSSLPSFSIGPKLVSSEAAGRCAFRHPLPYHPSPRIDERALSRAQ